MLKVIPTFTNYKIDEDGNVWSDITNKFLKAGTDKDGYRYVVLTIDKKPYTKKVHRLVAECFLPNFCQNLEVDHINDIRNDNRLCNLQMVTHQKNMYKTRGKVKHSEESKQKMSEARKGKKKSEETKQRISETLKARSRKAK